MLEAPAAVSVVDPKVLASTSITGQAPLAFQSVPGLDVVQSGVNDFNVNARGFNSSLNRRMLVLQDGRELGHCVYGAGVFLTAAINGLAALRTIELDRPVIAAAPIAPDPTTTCPVRSPAPSCCARLTSACDCSTSATSRRAL